MSDAALIARAATPMVEIIRNVKPDQWNAPTPCTEYDVRRLVNHLLFWGPALQAAARRESVPLAAATEQDVDLTDGDWAARLTAQVEGFVAAWGEPSAWEGTTTMGGPTEMPAAMVGGMVLGELVVHGWDLARATGQRPDWPQDVLAFTHRETGAMAEQARQMGIFGPEIPVPATDPVLHRMLGLTGRDPHWTG
jgi:uncharacterized protein (TIGR03086 family)